MIKDVPDDENTTEKTDGLSVEKIELLASGNGLYHSELLNPHILTPLTPAFQFSNHRKDASKAWSRPGKHLQSTESGLTFGPQYVMSPYSPTNIDSNAKVSDTANKILDLVSFDPELDYRGNAETVNDVSAGKMEPLFGISNHQDSPVTPMAVHSGIKNLQVFMQYDTPDVLNDAPMPLNTVKVISPDKKRVSPLHGQEHEFGCSSSAGVRTGRKFILKAVPSFPPLTPCIDSKISAVEPTNDPQNCSNDN